MDNVPERPEDFPIVTKIYMAPPDEKRKDAFIGALELQSEPNELASLLAAFGGEVAKDQARLYESWCHFGRTTLDRKSYLFRAKTSRKGELHFVMYSRMDFAFRHAQELKSRTKTNLGISRIRPNPFGMTFYAELANQTFTRLSLSSIAKKVAPVFATLILPLADLVYAFLFAQESLAQVELRTTIYIVAITVIFVVWTGLATKGERYALQLAP